MIYCPSPPQRWSLTSKERLAILRLFRRSAFLLLLLPVILAVYGCGGGVPQGAVAQVGQAVVSQEQFDQLEAAYQAAGHVPDKKTQAKDYRTFQQSLAQYMVMLEVLAQEAPQYGITVTDDDVKAQVADIREMFQGDQARFDAALKTQKLTLAQFKESLRESLLIDAMKAAVTKDVTVTEAEVKAYYNSHKGDYTKPEVRTARHILIDPHPTVAAGEAAITPTESDWEQAREEADKVRSEIQNGADFGTDARKYSDDLATKDDGGDLGTIVRGQMVPEFEEAVFSLKKGELSQPVRTEYGYHIIQVTDITPEAQLPYEQVKEKIRSALVASRQTATWDAWLKTTEDKLGVVYRSGFAPSKNATTISTMIPLQNTTETSQPEETTLPTEPTGTSGGS
jgi:parvulin-like peptidyl-prolyl isomerase